MARSTAAAVAMANYSMNWPVRGRIFDCDDDEVDRNDTKCTASGSPRYFIIIFGQGKKKYQLEQQQQQQQRANHAGYRCNPSGTFFSRGPDARFVSEPPFIAAPFSFLKLILKKKNVIALLFTALWELIMMMMMIIFCYFFFGGFCFGNDPVGLSRFLF